MTAIRVRNYRLPVIKPGWPGNLYENDNRFVDEEHPFAPQFTDVLKWTFSRNPQRNEKARDHFRLKVSDDNSFVHQNDDCIVWLGHATFYIRVSGVVILIDPVFYDLPFVKRYSKHALSPATLGRIDYLLISHDHRDHCQERSIREVFKHNPELEVLTGLRMDSLLKKWIPIERIQCAGWYQQFKTRSALALCFLPTRHWSKRSYNDTNTRLWGAFSIQSADHTIYFGGDTAYGKHFKHASELFPDIDIAILGVGAYKPSWMMTNVHISPEEAVNACNDLNASLMIPMHYGTFDLSDEPPGEPVSKLLSLKSAGKLNAGLKILNPGEVLHMTGSDDAQSMSA
ncbi:MBL fold metallo-hydrolase [Chryseolinea sp. T2]|uniref:MBL fold metallo-hydrolase n=1 Tax=Chryseolinea sp. T2 TaxID=3129255 RepID=UPI003077DBA3